MEAVGYNNSTKILSLVGGWNWVTGGLSQSYPGIQTGDVFLAKGLAYNFGHFIPEDAATNPQSANSLWNYAYVVQFGRDASNHLDGSYKILSVDSTAVFDNISSSYPLEGQWYANP